MNQRGDVQNLVQEWWSRPIAQAVLLLLTSSGAFVATHHHASSNMYSLPPPTASGPSAPLLQGAPMTTPPATPPTTPAAVRAQLKRDLLAALAPLGASALLPGATGTGTDARAALDLLLQRLELLTPTPEPLSPSAAPLLQRRWRLVYASNGTAVTRTVDGGGGIGLGPLLRGLVRFEAITQSVAAAGPLDSGSAPGSVSARSDSAADVRLPGPFGVVRLEAAGLWRLPTAIESSGGLGCEVEFESFGVRPAEVLGMRLPEELPLLRIPVPVSLSVAFPPESRTGRPRIRIESQGGL